MSLKNLTVILAYAADLDKIIVYTATWMVHMLVLLSYKLWHEIRARSIGDYLNNVPLNTNIKKIF